MQRRTPLNRRSKPIRKVSLKRLAQLTEYYDAARTYMADHPICMVWLVENGFKNYHVTLDASSVMIFRTMGAPAATEVHHKNKRRGKRLTDQTHWMAVCRHNHERIENNKAWARANGFLLNF